MLKKRLNIRKIEDNLYIEFILEGKKGSVVFNLRLFIPDKTLHGFIIGEHYREPNEYFSGKQRCEYLGHCFGGETSNADILFKDICEHSTDNGADLIWNYLLEKYKKMKEKTK